MSKIEFWRRCAWPVILAALIGCGCDDAKSKQAAQKAEADKQWQSELAALAEKHGALKHWEASLPSIGEVVRTPFSVEVSRALMPTNGQPVLLVMYLKDVTESAGKYTANFETILVTNTWLELCVEATCTPEQAETLLKSEGDLLQEWGLVATVSQVSRAKVRLQDPEDSETDVEMSSSPTKFVGKAVCLDFVRRPRWVSKAK